TTSMTQSSTSAPTTRRAASSRLSSVTLQAASFGKCGRLAVFRDRHTTVRAVFEHQLLDLTERIPGREDRVRIRMRRLHHRAAIVHEHGAHEGTAIRRDLDDPAIRFADVTLDTYDRIANERAELAVPAHRGLIVKPQLDTRVETGLRAA